MEKDTHEYTTQGAINVPTALSEEKENSHKRVLSGDTKKKYDPKKRKRCVEIIQSSIEDQIKLFVQSLVEVSGELFDPWIRRILENQSIQSDDLMNKEFVSSMVRASFQLRSVLKLRCFKLIERKSDYAIIVQPFSDPQLQVEWGKLDYQSQQCIQSFLLKKCFTNIKYGVTEKDVEYSAFKYDDTINCYLERGLCLLLFVGELLYLSECKFEATIIDTVEKILEQSPTNCRLRAIDGTDSSEPINNQLMIDDDALDKRVKTESDTVDYPDETRDYEPFLHTIIHALKTSLKQESEKSRHHNPQDTINRILEDLFLWRHNQDTRTDAEM